MMSLTRNRNELITHLMEQLRPAYIYPESALQNTWWLLEKVTGLSKTQLLIQSTIIFTPEQLEALETYVYQIVDEHKPLAYILGHVPFGDLNILVKEPILIPRSDTEQWVLELIQKLKSIDTPLTILDMCTGSGCIALALAHALPQSHVYGVDISATALELAHSNAAHNDIHNVTFIQSDLFNNLAQTRRFDVIVSNPPYISESEWQSLDNSVKKWEDTRALVADKEGLAILNVLITQAPLWLTHNPILTKSNIPELIVEIGYTQANAVQELFKKAGYRDIAIAQDLAHNDRTVSGRIDHVAMEQKTG
jgi:release factor glutamine methyltransferase